MYAKAKNTKRVGKEKKPRGTDMPEIMVCCHHKHSPVSVSRCRIGRKRMLIEEIKSKADGRRTNTLTDENRGQNPNPPA